MPVYIAGIISEEENFYYILQKNAHEGFDGVGQVKAEVEKFERFSSTLTESIALEIKKEEAIHEHLDMLLTSFGSNIASLEMEIFKMQEHLREMQSNIEKLRTYKLNYGKTIITTGVQENPNEETAPPDVGESAKITDITEQPESTIH